MHVATLLRYGTILNDRFIANLLPIVSVKQFMADRIVTKCDRLLASYRRLSVHPSVTLCIVALCVTVGV